MFTTSQVETATPAPPFRAWSQPAHTLAGWLLAALCLVPAATAEPVTFQDFDQPPHRYFERAPRDAFSKLKDDLEKGRLNLDMSSERAFLTSLLQVLKIPVASQMLVFSTTSLQLSLINPSNPRALYFNDDIYLGYIPGGRIEIVSTDPELGGIYYIFDIPRPGGSIRVERSNRCMNCHAGEDTGHVPGIVIKSVAPAMTGGSLDTFRAGQTGHAVPLEDRFGGWYVTGTGDWTRHWGNVIGELSGGNLNRIPNPPGRRFDFDRYPVPTSDILAHLIHEHQAGFVNRAVKAVYLARTHLHNDGGTLTREHEAELDEQARELTRYILFADEAPLPQGGFDGDSRFRLEFAAASRAVDGKSLRDLDLRTRIFKHRCSYMIYSTAFSGLPETLKQRIYRRLGAALAEESKGPESTHLSLEERRTIRRILSRTIGGLPAGW